MKIIKIENDKYQLQIYEAPLGNIVFRILKGTRAVITITIVVPENTTPEAWLLGLAAGMIVRDREGKRIRIGSRGCICFDIDVDAYEVPFLPLSYYNFTKDQLTTAIKSALAPEPKVDWPDWVKEGSRLIYNTSWDDWSLVSEDGSKLRLQQFWMFARPPLKTDHLDKTKVYIKGEG